MTIFLNILTYKFSKTETHFCFYYKVEQELLQSGACLYHNVHQNVWQSRAGITKLVLYILLQNWAVLQIVTTFIAQLGGN